MDFIPENIDNYSVEMTSPESELLSKIYRNTHLKVLRPRMLSGHLQGRFLSMVSQMIQPKYILEIGTYTGYSALCLAEGLTKDGTIITIDRNEELEDFLEEHIGQSKFANQIDIRYGNARNIIPSLANEIDLVFIDADKPNYSTYFDLIIDKVRTGGFILADNVLWSGKVVEQVDETDKSTIGLQKFNKKVNADPRVENVLLPLRDGIMILRKK